MLPSEAKAEEVNGLCRFGSKQGLMRHVMKHVLHNLEERWWRLLGDSAVREARNECRQEEQRPRFWEVARAYERFLAEHLLRACQAGVCHCHVAELSLGEALQQIVAAQVVYAWPVEERLFICAGAGVRNGVLGPYGIRTGYRHWPKVSKRRHVARAKEKAMERQRLGRHIIAIHDANEESDE